MNRQQTIWSIVGVTAVIAVLLVAFAAVWQQRQQTASPDTQLVALLEAADAAPIDLGPAPDTAMVTLGEALFFDKELSGNRDTACATCHHPTLAGADGLPLPLGTGGVGLGPARQIGHGRELVPRNATDLFNRGSADWNTMFWDGRVMAYGEHLYVSPAGTLLPDGLDGVLAVQAMFPVTSRDEMRGMPGDIDVSRADNELAIIPDDDFPAIWDGLMARLLAHPAYVELFAAAYPAVPTAELGFEHAANAIAAYEIAAFTFGDSPWDRYLAGDLSALSPEAKRGAVLFYGEAGCATCHSGSLLTDQAYHNLAVPQIGPGKDKASGLDYGRFGVAPVQFGVARPFSEMYTFRTPPLRNVTLTGPWMHNGAFGSLETAVAHHLDPAASLRAYEASTLPALYQEDVRLEPEVIDALLNGLAPELRETRPLTDAEMADLLAFLGALESPTAVDLSYLVPDSVPSGLPVVD